MNFNRVLIIGPDKRGTHLGQLPYFWFWTKPGQFYSLPSHKVADKLAAKYRADGWTVRDDRQEYGGNVWD